MQRASSPRLGFEPQIGLPTPSTLSISIVLFTTALAVVHPAASSCSEVPGIKCPASCAGTAPERYASSSWALLVCGVRFEPQRGSTSPV